ncbi:MAG: serine/threonine protein kinase [Phycisphaerae bacterium]|jgi:tetratricopeptide (TPR) repeat protein/predicted Ser/Thr protein kinase|nr:serine/threonine protein kinase [Phycisphaerae bacterium]
MPSEPSAGKGERTAPDLSGGETSADVPSPVAPPSAGAAREPTDVEPPAASGSGFESEAIFFEALAIAPAERTSWLARRCGRDRRLAADVASLLAAADRSSGFLEKAPSELFEVARQVGSGSSPQINLDLDVAAAESLVGRTVGEFTLRAVIGQGGMGVVYRAEQRQPNRTVALKLVRPGYASPNMIRRLAFEAEMLGRLRHPGIAAVYAAGTADLGFGQQPYVAMEFCEGWPLREWIKAESPDATTKVRLLIDIAEAVRHAHENGIIHRDLKPENLLVETSGQPRPRVLDFGVARLADRGDASAARANATEAGHLVGTLQYMSPEQVRGEAVDARSDVFALGLIAWELFAGRPARTIDRSSLVDAVRQVAEQPIPKVSEVAPEIKPDLGLIIGKALESEPARRYESAGALADDLHRFLTHEPIRARAPTTAYVAMRYVQRHWALVSIAATLAIALPIVVVALILALRSENEARLAELNERARALDATAVTDYILWSLRLDANAPRVAPADRAALLPILAELAANVDDRMAGRPEAQVRVLNRVGEGYNVLTEYELSKATFERAIRICDESLGKDHALRGAALHGLAAAEWFRSQRDGSREGLERTRGIYQEALDTRLRTLGRENAETALTMRHLAATLRTLDRLDEAEPLYRESLAIHERLHEHGDPLADDSMLASGYNGLATFLSSQRRYAEAEPLLIKALATMRSMKPTARRVVDEARVLRNLGATQGANQRFEEGAASLVEAESIFRQQLGDTSREIAGTRLRLAQLELVRNNVDRARELATSVIADFGLGENDALVTDARKILATP